MKNNIRVGDDEQIPTLSLLQAATLFLWVVPSLADQTTPTRLDFKKGAKILYGDKSLSSNVSALVTKGILDRKRLRDEKREAYGHFFGDVTRVRISGWPDTYDVTKPIPEDLKAALEETVAAPRRRYKRIT
ncbi:MAG: hypothetical protein HY617_00670 [Candidatus Sungbacteria bacterium]|nr:hypothetical protein [Candidatus Sungbacteria bacterium]